jgi:ribosomal protein S12 methylthiotransferase
LLADGMEAATTPDAADLVVVNTCAFIEEARQESIDVVLAMSERRREGAEVVVTGCLAERHGDELAAAIPEVSVRGFGVPVVLGRRQRNSFDLLNLPRPRSPRPWAYVKIAEGCDRACGFCAIPTFRGKQRSRSFEAILDEIEQLDIREAVLVAQDLASYGRDQGIGEKSIVPLVEAVAARVDWVRLLYLYPSELNDKLIDAICATGVPYFDLSLQHVSAPLLRRMRRWGNGERFVQRIRDIRRREPTAVFRTNFIVGYPGETEADHDQLMRFLDEAQLEWCGFFAYSAESGTYAETLDGAVDRSLVDERLRELGERQDAITAAARDALIGATTTVLVDAEGVARSHREAPEIDGVINVPASLRPGTFHSVEILGAMGPDLEAHPLGDAR